ncbi:MAG: cytochrome-c oxidase, cbb3-type subunit I [Flavobacteriaceae bacterium]|nr:cytochrome-c oxidase, cbb3-type subunit I [Flavobacteriaceae bacterium]
MEKQQFYYDNKIVKMFFWATVLWGVVGMLVGLLVAYLFLFPNYLTFAGAQPWLGFGRLRPLHTNAAIFAFVGNGFFLGMYYSMQRLLKTRMFSDFLSRLHFWGWQLIIVLAAVTLPLGISSSKEYAELQWPIDILVVLVWVVMGINMIGTLIKRRQRHIYVAIWFYISTLVTIAMLYIVNNLELPIALTSMKSYSLYSGVKDAMVQWWYGHNAVAFFLTTPMLGLMYYFVPKAANRPVYSYRLSIIHFWTLIFIYIWAGPHHLLYSALPDWIQNLGTVFSVMLIFPSWGGMINGLLTLRGAWDKVREDPVLKFFVVAITAYGMATFEGPMLSFKNLNAIAHFTDWIVGHVHIGTLGWNGFLLSGILYWLVQKLYKTDLWSTKLANYHFWIGTIGILFYSMPLYIAGFAQAFLWKQFDESGTLVYGNFLETVTQIIPMYAMRAFGGTLYFTGFVLLAINLLKTAAIGSKVEDELAEAMPLEKISGQRATKEGIHTWLERKVVLFTVLAFIATAIGGAVQIIPLLVVKSNIPEITSVKPYSPLEVEGRDIYIREGCNNCHSQLVRPFRSEVERYGEYSKAGEYVYDFPFLWGSRRTGPDVHRLGGKYNDNWHFNHMMDPRSTSEGSIMPMYPWLIKNKLDYSMLEAKLKALKTLGVPYTDEEIAGAKASLETQAKSIEQSLHQDPEYVKNYATSNIQEKEIVALIAYLQRLGMDIKANQTAQK